MLPWPLKNEQEAQNMTLCLGQKRTVHFEFEELSPIQQQNHLLSGLPGNSTEARLLTASARTHVHK